MKDSKKTKKTTPDLKDLKDFKSRAKPIGPFSGRSGAAFHRLLWLELLFPIFCWVVLLWSPASLAWCCLSSTLRWRLPSVPVLGWVGPRGLLRAVLLFQSPVQVVLPAFPSSRWGCLPPPPLGSAAWFSPLRLGGAAWSTLRCCLGSPPLGPRSPPPLLGGAAFLFPPLGSGAFSPLVCWVALLGFPPLGGVAFFFFSLWWYCLPLSSSGWRLLFFPVFCWVVLLGPPGGGALFFSWCCLSCPGWGCIFPLWFSFSGWCCLFSPPSGRDYFSTCLLLGGAAWFTPPWGVLGPALSPPLGGVAFPISFQVVLPSFPSFGVELPSSPSVGWCCRFLSLLLGWGCVPPLFGWVVLLGFQSFFGWCCFPFPSCG